MMYESYQAAIDFARDRPMAPILVLQGPHGTGKSHLLEAIGRDMLEQGYLVKYVFVPDWLAMLKSTFDNKSEEQYDSIFDSYKNVEVLLFDDLGRERVTDWTKGEVIRIIDHRHRNGMLTVVTTNDDEYKTVSKQAEGLADRLFDMGTGIVRVVPNTGKSYRTGR